MEIENILNTVSGYLPSLFNFSFWVDTLLAILIGEVFNFIRSKRSSLYYQSSGRRCVAAISTLNTDTGHSTIKYIYEENLVLWNQGSTPVSFDEMSKVHRPAFLIPSYAKLFHAAVHSQYDEDFVNLQIYPDKNTGKCEFTFDRIAKRKGFAVNILTEEEYGNHDKPKFFQKKIQCYFPHFTTKIKYFAHYFQKPDYLYMAGGILMLFLLGSYLRPEFTAKGICAETVLQAVLYLICILLAYLEIRNWLVRFRMPAGLYRALLEVENPHKIRLGSFKRFEDSFSYQLSPQRISYRGADGRVFVPL